MRSELNSNTGRCVGRVYIPKYVILVSLNVQTRKCIRCVIEYPEKMMKAFLNEYSPLAAQFYNAFFSAVDLFPMHLCTIQQN